ncbi:NAD(P)/FAD-dependent oxidoreductase [Lampropedia puyangensis]|uniref:NAD(P)/FAD-dependent oxidoreductase n=1 Tax=Lampropedia puyangensis TaxID=1330072 RepID=A0A4S8FAZ7_9BURK|nr:NAD(P)/FAD-dependent oxidoreductase [Lampropedia puyangensis]THU04015.1 NAD(P)/FAD-dependent oxidoreductase [Lampropedia puyangensis]
MSYPTVVIGAGVVGLAVARALALRGHEVIVLEAETAIGTQTSSRNSEVIHAGIYYTQGSLKAQLCVQGKALLYAYCEERGIAYQRLGKLIVATEPAQEAQLNTIAERARNNGVHDLKRLSQQEALALEPHIRCHGALLSPSTGIVDSHALMLHLQGDIENAGGVVALVCAVASIDASTRLRDAQAPLLIRTLDGNELEAGLVVNAAGHGAIPLAHRTQGMNAQHIPQAYFVKGQYFTLTGKTPFQRLIYPVPQIGGLGVHLTLDLGGQGKFGPDVHWCDRADDLEVREEDAAAFAQAIQAYWPDVSIDRLQPGYAGMRPNIGGPKMASPDFAIQGPQTHGIAGLVHLFGIESPGLTSCMAIGNRTVQALGLE